MHIFYKSGSEEKLKELFPNSENKSFMTGLKIETHESTKQLYSQVYEDPFDPTATLPAIPEELVDRYTVRSMKIDNRRCFRTEGIYELYGAVLRCYQDQQILDGGLSDMDGDRTLERQLVDISAPTLETLRAIYHQFRQGKLSPKEDWEARQIIPTSEQPTA